MAGLDAIELADRLHGERQDYWLHVEADSPLEKYPAKQHARRVVEKLGVSNGLIYLPGALAKNNEDSDMAAPFRQRRYFYYISGCPEPDCHVIYDIQNDNLSLFIPRINPARVIWNGRGSTPAEALAKYDIDSVFYSDQTQEIITKWLNHYKGPLYVLRDSMSPMAAGTPELDSTSLLPAMVLARVVKTDHEIQLIKKANDISSQAHTEVLANILRFRNEAEVEGLFLNVCISQQAKQQAYDPIAASGPNAGTLHYDANNEDFQDRQLMCLDAGCEYQLYASDITRTFPLSGDWPSQESKEIYRLVERMQEACIERMAPGVRFLDLHILAHQIAIDGLLNLGILHNGTKEEIFKAGTSRAFFPHGLGHHVGLEVHDVGHAELISAVQFSQQQKAISIYPSEFHVPVYDSANCIAPVHPESGHLEEGMVVTVEPGIYFSLYALNMFYLPSPIHSKYINLSVLKKYLPVGGVRIEDDILITSKGYENLTTAPKGDAMLEIIRSQNANSYRATEPSVRREAIVEPTMEEKEAEQKLRAPGVPAHMLQPVPEPIRRAGGPMECSPAHPNFKLHAMLNRNNQRLFLEQQENARKILLAEQQENARKILLARQEQERRHQEVPAQIPTRKPVSEPRQCSSPPLQHRMFLHRLEQERRRQGISAPMSEPIAEPGLRLGPGQVSHALQDYQLQLMLLEQQNKKRLLLARQEQDVELKQQAYEVPHKSQDGPHAHAWQDYQMQLMLLEQQNKKNLLLARQEQDREIKQETHKPLPKPLHGQNGANTHALQDFQMQLMLLEQQNNKRRALAKQEQDEKIKQEERAPLSKSLTEPNTHALQDFQLEQMLLDQQIKRAAFVIKQEQERERRQEERAPLSKSQNGPNTHALQDFQMQLMLDQHNKRVAFIKQEQERERGKEERRTHEMNLLEERGKEKPLRSMQGPNTRVPAQPVGFEQPHSIHPDLSSTSRPKNPSQQAPATITSKRDLDSRSSLTPKPTFQHPSLVLRPREAPPTTIRRDGSPSLLMFAEGQSFISSEEADWGLDFTGME